jgi:hypothetical protein
MMDLARVVHHLMVEQRSNVLDRTKCSVTARHVYNFLCGDAIVPNNNLSRVEPNLGELADRLLAGPIVAYVHFDHMTNDTSHYFILVSDGKNVLVLQSAVFEFSIRDWLFPEEALAEADELLELQRREHAKWSGELARFRIEQCERDHVRQSAVLASVRQCAFSSARPVPLDVFLASFVAPLADLEGRCLEHEVQERSRTFRRLFACVLQEEVVRAQLAAGFDKAAAFKFHAVAVSHAVVDGVGFGLRLDRA